MLLMAFYSVRRERQLCEQLDYDPLLFRGYAVSQRVRKRIEEVFGWLTTVATSVRLAKLLEPA
jgi:hypothetical protein